MLQKKILCNSHFNIETFNKEYNGPKIVHLVHQNKINLKIIKILIHQKIFNQNKIKYSGMFCIQYHTGKELSNKNRNFIKIRLKRAIILNLCTLAGIRY